MKNQKQYIDMRINKLLFVALTVTFILGCANQSKVIETPKEISGWSDEYDPSEWREKFKKCQAFLHSDNDAWHWCMNNE